MSHLLIAPRVPSTSGPWEMLLVALVGHCLQPSTGNATLLSENRNVRILVPS